MKSRFLLSYVQKEAAGPNGRILVFTGARQTGKTTLSRQAFPDYAYLSIEDPVTRSDYRRLTSAQANFFYSTRCARVWPVDAKLSKCSR